MRAECLQTKESSLSKPHWQNSLYPADNFRPDDVFADRSAVESADPSQQVSGFGTFEHPVTEKDTNPMKKGLFGAEEEVDEEEDVEEEVTEEVTEFISKRELRNRLPSHGMYLGNKSLLHGNVRAEREVSISISIQVYFNFKISTFNLFTSGILYFFRAQCRIIFSENSEKIYSH